MHHLRIVTIIFVQVLHDKSDKEIPLLVYVSREKRPHQPHHFKAGALNVLVSLCFYSSVSLKLIDTKKKRKILI